MSILYLLLGWAAAKGGEVGFTASGGAGAEEKHRQTGGGAGGRGDPAGGGGGAGELPCRPHRPAPPRHRHQAQHRAAHHRQSAARGSPQCLIVWPVHHTIPAGGAVKHVELPEA